MHNLQFRGTYANLLAGLQTLTPEQLAQSITAASESRMHSDVSLEITREAQFYADGEWTSESDLDDEEREGLEREEAGQVYFYLHD